MEVYLSLTNLLKPFTNYVLARHQHNLEVVSNVPLNEQSFILALFRYSFPKFQSLLTTTSSTAARLCPYVQSIPKNSGFLQHNYNDSVSS